MDRRPACVYGGSNVNTTNAIKCGAYGLLVATTLAVLGCSKPSAANIELRKQNDELRARLTELEGLKRAGALAPVATTRAEGVALSQLYVASGLRFGRLTGVEGRVLRVHLTPTDQAGDDLKAAGSLTVRAYDLSKGREALVGEWAFSSEQAARAWNGKGLMYAYALECPIEREVAAGQSLRLRAEFTDLLTGKTVTAETDTTVR